MKLNFLRDEYDRSKNKIVTCNKAIFQVFCSNYGSYNTYGNYMFSKKKRINYTASSDASIINPDLSVSPGHHLFSIYKSDEPVSLKGMMPPNAHYKANVSRIICIESGPTDTRQLTVYIVNINTTFLSNIFRVPIKGVPWEELTFHADRLNEITDSIQNIRSRASEFIEFEITDDQLELFNKIKYRLRSESTGHDECDRNINKLLSSMSLSNEFSSNRTACTIC